MRLYRGGILLICLAVLTGCGNPDSSAIESQFVESGHKSVDLALAVPGNWDRVCILGPYSGDASARQALGFDWPAEALTSIEENDGISLLVFVKNDKVLTYLEHSRGFGDFSNLTGRCFLHTHAKFVLLAHPKRGWPGLFPLDES